MSIPLLIAAGAGLAGSVVSAWGQKKANETNLQIAREQMGFQERMSSSAVTRRMEDMRIAGINPILAGGMEASSPGGASARMENVGASAEGAGSSALSLLMAKKSMKLLDQQIAKTNAEASTARSQADLSSIERALGQAKFGMYFESSGKPKGLLRELLMGEHNRSMANSARSLSEAQLAEFSIPERKALADLFEQLGAGGSGLQKFMPLLLQLMRR